MGTIISKGRGAQVLNLSVSATVDTQLGFTRSINAVIIQCKTAVDLQLRTTASSPDFFTIKSGTVFSLDLMSNVNNDATFEMPLWIRSGTGTVTVEVIGLYGG